MPRNRAHERMLLEMDMASESHAAHSAEAREEHSGPMSAGMADANIRELMDELMRIREEVHGPCEWDHRER